ncbi:uncharacterized protein LOC124131329 [Haliotis rufescens]|uniref:uncharacterized protein LOC124131329 n=1 Tax=Haliotis rufescens TaxID=6454 RepID=UPI00201EB116|nr:uncharacterized protein LOC124131329 [Haliotis rufescens]XP_048253636.1 uncharacterized protein LOC124131329 [Haliotis rufescens]XP_048253639.1 uncharacterized protein LOC124131329 [Haliotis rufescens]
MGCGTSFPLIPQDSNFAPTVEKPHIREQNDSESFNADCLDGAVHSSQTTELVKGTSDIQLIQTPEAPGLPHTTNPSDQTPVLSSTMSSDIPATNEDCLQLAQQLVTKYPRLKSGFDDINSFIHALEEDPMLDTKGEQIRMLAHKTIGLSYVNKDESHRRVFAEYLSYTRAADVMYKTYSSYLKARKLEFLTEKVSRAQLTEEGSYQFIREMRGLLWNYTDASVQFSERVCGSGLLRYFVGDLKAILKEAGSPAKVSATDPMFRSARGVLHNCSNSPVTRQPIRELGTVSVAMAYLKGDAPEMKMMLLLLLANIIDEDDNKALLADSTVFTIMLNMIMSAWRDQRHRCNGFSASELIVGLTGLAKNDDNKKILTEKGAIPVLMTVMQEGSDDEREKAVQCVWELAFDKENQRIFVENAELMAILRKMNESQNNKKLSKVSGGALWAITQEEKRGNKKLKKKDAVKKGEIVQDAGHVMISYQWADQKMLIKVKEFLKKHNFKVWMDIDNMEGSTLQAMAEAVQNASVVLVCMSERYKLSQNCRSEAEYAFDLRKPIIPLVLQRGYKPDGWLGLIKGAKLFFDFSGKYPFDQKASELIKELGVRGKAGSSTDSIDGETTAIVKSQPADAARGADGTANWSNKDVHNWLCKMSLDKHSSLKSLTGKQLMFLRKISYKAPEFFYNYIKTDLHLSNLEDLMTFSEAVENL